MSSRDVRFKGGFLDAHRLRHIPIRSGHLRRIGKVVLDPVRRAVVPADGRLGSVSQREQTETLWSATRHAPSPRLWVSYSLPFYSRASRPLNPSLASSARRDAP